MRFKWSKLLMNLGNALEAAVGPIGRESDALRRARAPRPRRCSRRRASTARRRQEDAERRGDLIAHAAGSTGERRGGGSTWQSLARGTGSVEADQLNGEIVLLGRLHGVPTPVNALLQDGRQRAGPHRRARPASLTEADLLARLG